MINYVLKATQLSKATQTKSLVSQARPLRFLTSLGSFYLTTLATLYGKDRQI